jgi:hypothetical protein
LVSDRAGSSDGPLTKMSDFELLSPSMRLDAVDSNATVLPSSEISAMRESSFPCVPLVCTETRVTLISPGSSKTPS